MRLPTVLNLIGVLALLAAAACAGLAMWSPTPPYAAAVAAGVPSSVYVTAAVAAAISAPIWFAIARVISLLERIAGERQMPRDYPALD